MTYQLYFVDCETTGLDENLHEPIEISIYRLSDNAQKTWFLKPINISNIDQGALRVSGYSLDDLKGLTKDGKEKFLSANKQIIDIENWLNEDNLRSDNRLMVGHNVDFDRRMMAALWKKCETYETFPFSVKHSLDTMIIEFFMDYSYNEIAEGYNLNSLCKKYGVVNAKAHTASEDVKATLGIFNKQIEKFQKLIEKSLLK